MTIIGYNKSGFIIRNSWGTAWGKNGYCIFPYSDWYNYMDEVWCVFDEDNNTPFYDNIDDSTILFVDIEEKDGVTFIHAAPEVRGTI